MIIYDYMKTIDYEEEKVESDEMEYFILFLENGKCIKVNMITKTIIEQFDGKKTLKEVLEVVKKDGIILNEEKLILIIENKLLPIGIFQNNSKKEQEKKSIKIWFHWKVVDGKKIEFLLEKMKFLYNKNIVIFQIFLFILGQIYMVLSKEYLGNFSKWESIDWIFCIIIVLFSFVFHELGHATAANYYQCKVREIGIGLYLFRPVLYTDLSYTWKLSKRKRVIVDVGGIYFQIVLMNLVFGIFCFYKREMVATLLLFTIIICLFNLNPFLKLDGYWILSDYLEVNNINKLAFTYLEDIKYRILKKDIKSNSILNLNSRYKKVIYVYVVGYLILTGSVFAIGVYVCIDILIHPFQMIEITNDFMRKIYIKDYESLLFIFLFLLMRILSFIYVFIFVFKLIKKYINYSV